MTSEQRLDQAERLAMQGGSYREMASRILAMVDAGKSPIPTETSLPELMQELHEKETSLPNDNIPDDVREIAKQAVNEHNWVSGPVSEAVAKAILTDRAARPSLPPDPAPALVKEAEAALDGVLKWYGGPTAHPEEWSECMIAARNVSQSIKDADLAGAVPSSPPASGEPEGFVLVPRDELEVLARQREDSLFGGKTIPVYASWASAKLAAAPNARDGR